MDPIMPVLIAFATILICAKAGGEIFERLGQPAVLGELIAGVVLGNLGLISQSWGVFAPLRAEPLTEHWAITIDGFARIGVILLLFEVGLESTVGEMRRVGASSFLVALVGVIAPFVLGYAVSALFVHSVPPVLLAMNPSFDIVNIHLFIGATLSATSVGITARVLKDLDRIGAREAKIILGAAVIDDVLGLIILAVVSGIVVAAETGAPLGVGSLLAVAGAAVGFLFGAIVLGIVAAPRIMGFVSGLHSRGMMLVSSVIFCFMLSYLATLAGLATIVGAFAAGLILEDVHFAGFSETLTIRQMVAPITTLFVPVFFVLMGIQVRLESLVETRAIGIGLALTAVAILGKQVCGLAAIEKGLDRLSIGLGMIPRGEVGLIFASIGKGLRVIDNTLFSAVVMMVVLTTLVTPPLLKFSFGRSRGKGS